MNSTIFKDISVTIAQYTERPQELLQVCKSTGLQSYFRELKLIANDVFKLEKVGEYSIDPTESIIAHYLAHKISNDIFYRYLKGKKLQAFILYSNYKGPLTKEYCDDVFNTLIGDSVERSSVLYNFHWCKALDFLISQEFIPYSSVLTEYIKEKVNAFPENGPTTGPTIMCYIDGLEKYIIIDYDGDFPYYMEHNIDPNIGNEINIDLWLPELFDTLPSNAIYYTYHVISYYETLNLRDNKEIPKMGPEEILEIKKRIPEIAEEFLEKYKDYID